MAKVLALSRRRLNLSFDTLIESDATEATALVSHKRLPTCLPMFAVPDCFQAFQSWHSCLRRSFSLTNQHLFTWRRRESLRKGEVWRKPNMAHRLRCSHRNVLTRWKAEKCSKRDHSIPTGSNSEYRGRQFIKEGREPRSLYWYSLLFRTKKVDKKFYLYKPRRKSG